MKKIYSLLAIAFALAATASAQATFTVVNNNPDTWTQLALYSWDNSGGTNVEAFGTWPGVVLYDGTTLTDNSDVQVTKSGNTFTVTVKNYVSTMNLIINNNGQGSQLDLTDFANGKSYEIAAPPSTPTDYTQSIYFINDGWDAVALYNWGGSGEIYGTWPGVVIVDADGNLNPAANALVKVEKVSETTDGYPVYKIGLGDGSGFQNLIFNNNNQGSQFDVEYEDGAFYNTTGKTTEEATAINAVRVSESTNAPAYSIGGNRITTTHRGIVVCNGKKYIAR